MTVKAGTETDVTGAGAAATGAKPAAVPASARLPFVDGLGPLVLGVLWMVGAKAFAFFSVFFIPALLAQKTPGVIFLVEETRSIVMSESGGVALLFAGLARAATPWAVGRETLSAQGLGRAAFALLLAAFAAWVLLNASFLVPGLWPSPFANSPLGEFAPAIPKAIYWADFAVLAAFYGSLVLFALQILTTVAVGLRYGEGRVGPAAMALVIASLVALFALPDDLRHGYIDLTTPAVSESSGNETGLAAKAYTRRDGRFYVYDQLKLTVLDFIAIAAAFGVLTIAVWRGSGGALRWSWLSSFGIVIFGLGTWFTLANIGLASPNAMARALTTATLLCTIAFLLTPLSWLRTLLTKDARRGAPALWAMAALLPTSVAIVAVPTLASYLELATDWFDIWIAAFDSLDAILLIFAIFAGWYAMQHRLTGRETGPFWSSAHLLIAFLISGGAAFGAFYKVYLERAMQLATGSLAEEHQFYASFGVVLAEYLVFLIGLLLARRMAFSRFEPATSAALGAASRAASAAKPKETVQRTTLFGGDSADAADDGAPASEATAVERSAEQPAEQSGEPAAESAAISDASVEKPKEEQTAEAPAAAAAPEAAPEDVVVVGEDQGGVASEESAGSAEDGSEAPDDKAPGS